MEERVAPSATAKRLTVVNRPLLLLLLLVMVAGMAGLAGAAWRTRSA